MKKPFDVVGLGALGVDYLAQVPEFADKDNKTISDNVTLFDGGVTANNVVQCARLGMKTKWCGAIGKDDLAAQVSANLRKEKIQISTVKIDRTQFCWIAVDKKGDRQIYVFPNATRKLTPAVVKDFFRKDIESCVHFHTEIAVIPLNAALAGARIAHKTGAKIFLDVDGNIDALVKKDKIGTAQEVQMLLRMANVVKLSQNALPSITKVRDIRRGMKKLLQTAEVVAVTLGDKGCYVGNKKEIIYCPAYTVRCVDGTGAGDAFMGGLSYALWKNMPLREIGMFANACGAYACTQMGARGAGRLDSIKALL